MKTARRHIGGDASGGLLRHRPASAFIMKTQPKATSCQGVPSVKGISEPTSSRRNEHGAAANLLH